MDWNNNVPIKEKNTNEKRFICLVGACFFYLKKVPKKGERKQLQMNDSMMKAHFVHLLVVLVKRYPLRVTQEA